MALSASSSSLPAFLLAAALAPAAFAAPVHAGSNPTPLSAADAAAKLPPAQTVGAVSFTTGGIGLPESDLYKRAEPAYPLSMEFLIRARPRDEYAADVTVKMKDARGRQVLDTLATGPFLLAKVPPGRYEVEAIRKGIREIRKVDVASGAHRRLVFEWTS